ncbi:MAG: putative Ig domain-containing protein, partial [Propionivibrio sp.]
QTMSVVASYTDGHGTNETKISATTAAVANVNDAPTGTVTISGTPTQGQTLTAANTLADADGPGPINYQWQANGSDIVGATGNTLVLAESQVGQLITVSARYTDGHGTSETVISVATAAVGNVNDEPTGTVTISGTPIQGQTLTAANTLADDDGLGTISYQWRANGSEIVGATGNTLALAETQVGRLITVSARYTDGHGTSETVSSAPTVVVANINDAPTGTVTISGTPTQGQTLTVANTLADADGLGTISYQWQANGSNIVGATGATITLGEAQLGQTMSVVASYTDGHGTNETVSSAASAPVVHVNNVPVLAVSVGQQQATAAQGFLLVLPSNTFIDADVGDSLSYGATLASGAVLPSWLHFDSATQTFSGTPTLGDVGAVNILVTATDSGGLAAQLLVALSVSSPQVLAAPIFSGPDAPATTISPPAIEQAELTPASAEEPKADEESQVQTTEISVPGTLASSADDTTSRADESPATRPRSNTAVDMLVARAPASDSDNVLAEVPLQQLGSLTSSSLSQILSGDELQRRFEEMRRQLDAAADARRAIVASGVALSGGLSVGYVVWLVRGGVLASAMLSALPAWQMIDPLPVLAAARKKTRREAGEQGVERLFDKTTRASSIGHGVGAQPNAPSAASIGVAGKGSKSPGVVRS